MAMANLRNVGAFLAGNNRGSNLQTRNVEDIVKQGKLCKRKKNKNTKELYFVLRKETSKDLPSRLEIYDSENKFREGANPKKKYILKDFFDISLMPNSSSKPKDMIALYIKNKKDYVALVAHSEMEMKEWLNVLQQYKNDGSEGNEGTPRINYEHVWPVEVQPRSFANKQNLAGHQWACLTNTLLTLVRIENASKKTECHLHTIRKCGHVNQFFFVELGRYSPIGCGMLWMKTEDSVIAENMYQIVGDAMSRIGSFEGSETRERAKSVSTAKREDTLHQTRNRSDSVPASAKGQCFSNNDITQNCSEPSRYGQSSRPPSMYDYGVSQTQFGSPVSSESIISSSEEDRHYSPEFTDDHSEYVEMNDSKECSSILHPKTLPIHNISVTSSGSACTPQGTSTPVSPSGGSLFWGTQFRNHQPSPHGSSGSHSAAHSRSSSLVDDTCDGYLSMLPPLSSSNSLSPALPHSSCSPSHYLEMGPGIGSEKRAVSTPTPIPASPSDCESYHEMSPNSGSSSFTSGTPSSDQRLHDLGGDRPCSSRCGLGSNYSGGEEMDSLEMRPIRTSSVGSKPEQFKRKNRLDAVIVGEPARVRAFSVGSRVSLKFGRLGASGGTQGNEPPASGLGELFPSIKECGKQAKSKSSSAPMLDVSPVSHSWSGTPGSYFRSVIQNRNLPRQKDLGRMELDFSQNKSYDFIPSEEKEKERKTSKERLWHTFTSFRQRSNSKSSGGSNSRVNGGESAREKKLSESEMCSRGVEIPASYDRNEYYELDFNPSPRSVASDSSKGYLPMHPPSGTFLSSIFSGTDSISKRGPRQSSINDSYYDMSSSLSSCASQDGYVDMTQGSTTSVLTIASSSSSTNSVNCSTNFNRKVSGVINPLSSLDLPSPMEDFMDMDINSEGGDLSRKKGKKGSKRKSFKESAKRKKSDSGTFPNRPEETDSTEFPQKNKASGPFSTLTNLISRKPSTSKAPTSPLGSPVSKSAKESSSPFSSLKRSKSKDVSDSTITENLEIPDEEETANITTDCHRKMCSLSSELSKSPVRPTLEKKTLSSSMDISAQFGINKNEEKMLLSPSETGKLLWPASSCGDTSTVEKRVSAYMNLDLCDETTSGSLPALNIFQKPLIPLVDNGNYMNMQPGGNSSPQLSPPAKKEKPSPSIEEVAAITNATSNVAVPREEESNYMIMGHIEKETSHVLPYSVPSVTRRPHIPQKLLTGRSHPPSLGLEKLAINEHAMGGSTERSRSHSGPGASESGTGNKNGQKNLGNDERAASACSSPVSYSPPTSPTLGSVSSMSSLSEGGLSSASSTCTVVNVGVQRLGGATSCSKGSVVSQDVCSSTSESQCSHKPSKSKSSSREENTISYACLDLGVADTKDPSTTQLHSTNVVGNISAHEDKSQNYVAIDFAKSEQLKTFPQPPH